MNLLWWSDMSLEQVRFLCSGIVIGLKKAKEIFRESLDSRGGCKLLSKGDECRCFLCLCDVEIARAEKETQGGIQ